jgi:triosephosphate isomerase
MSQRSRTKVAAGNWKMNGKLSDLKEVTKIAQAARMRKGVSTLLCLPPTLFGRVGDAGLSVGAQDCHICASGAHTGDISAEMIADAGATHVIVGHSERRTDYLESDRLVKQKAQAVLEVGLTAIICVGESREQYEAGQALTVLQTQIKGSIPETANCNNVIIAYEPVWAIGTGLLPTNEEIQSVHFEIREMLGRQVADGKGISILYGGSVKGSNAAEIFALPDVDGALVGGASLKANDFIPIIEALDAAEA